MLEKIYYHVELVGFIACIKSHLYLEIIKDLKMSTKMSKKRGRDREGRGLERGEG